jgi:hypothetical protein
LKIQSESKGFLNLLDIIGRARPNAYESIMKDLVPMLLILDTHYKNTTTIM